MALKRLTIAEMATLTKSWVQPGHAVRKALERVPGMLALMPRIDEVQASVLTAQHTEKLQTSQDISTAAGEADARHDNLARAVDKIIEGGIFQAYADNDIARAHALEKLRTFVLPHGMRVVNFGYREEAGQAELLASRMTQDHRTLLASIPVYNGTVLTLVDRWMAAAAELGELEDLRADQDIPGREVPHTRVRSEWIDMVQAVRTIIRLSKVVDPVLEEALNRIRVAELAADRRPTGTSSDVVDEPADATPDPDGPDSPADTDIEREPEPV